MDTRKIVFALVLFAVSPAVFAKPLLLWCDSCTNDQKKGMALAQAVGEVVYVGDVIGRTFKAYRVSIRLDDHYNPPLQIKIAPEILIDPDYADVLNALLDFFAYAPAGWAKNLAMHYPNQDVNVYDVVFRGPQQNNLLDWVAGAGSANLNDIADRLISVASAFRIVDQTKVPKITYVITFWDGSKITVSVDFSTENAVYEVVPDSGRDSHNNTVLSIPSNSPIQFDFNGPGNPTDRDMWQNIMQLHGYGIPVQQGVMYACTRDPGNGLHCVLQR